MKIEIDGKEIELQGIEADSIVIMRPTKPLSREELWTFNSSVRHLSDVFSRHRCSLIGANFDQVTFEVLKVKSEDLTASLKGGE